MWERKCVGEGKLWKGREEKGVNGGVRRKRRMVTFHDVNPLPRNSDSSENNFHTSEKCLFLF